MYDYDHSKTADEKGPIEEQLHKASRDLQHAITTIDQVAHMRDIPPMAQGNLKTLVKNLEASADKLEFSEGTIRIWEKSK